MKPVITFVLAVGLGVLGMNVIAQDLTQKSAKSVTPKSAVAGEPADLYECDYWGKVCNPSEAYIPVEFTSLNGLEYRTPPKEYKNEADKRATIRQIFSQRKFKSSYYKPTTKLAKQKAQACHALFKDFSTLQNVTLVEPKVRVDRIDDPAMMPYHRACPGMRFYASIDIDPKDEPNPSEYNFIETPLGRAMEFDARLTNGRGVSYPTRDFKIYELPLPGKVLLTVFSGERWLYKYGSYPPQLSSGYYKLVDFNQCKEKGGSSFQVPGYGASVSDERRDGDALRDLENLHGIFERKGAYYTFTVDGALFKKGEYYSLLIESISEPFNSPRHQYCSFNYGEEALKP